LSMQVAGFLRSVSLSFLWALTLSGGCSLVVALSPQISCHLGLELGDLSPHPVFLGCRLKLLVACESSGVGTGFEQGTEDLFSCLKLAPHSQHPSPTCFSQIRSFGFLNWHNCTTILHFSSLTFLFGQSSIRLSQPQLLFRFLNPNGTPLSILYLSSWGSQKVPRFSSYFFILFVLQTFSIHAFFDRYA